MKKTNFLFNFIGILLLFLIWEGIALGTKEAVVPEFFSCFYSTCLLLGKSYVWEALGRTILKAFLALLISGVFGSLLGLVAGYHNWLRKILGPSLTLLKSVPTIALVLLFIVYVPHFEIYVIAIVLFPLFFEAAYEGSNRVYREYHYLLILNGKNRLNNITKVLLPLSAPSWMMGLLQSVSLSLKIAVMAEVFSYSAKELGIGNLIYQAYSNVEYHTLMAYVLLILFIGLILDGLLYLLSNLVKKNVE